jgi:hypothetical protein
MTTPGRGDSIDRGEEVAKELLLEVGCAKRQRGRSMQSGGLIKGTGEPQKVFG